MVRVRQTAIQVQSGPRSLPKAGLDVLDYALFLPSMWLTCGLGVQLRLFGPLFAVVPVGSCLLYAILRLTAPPRMLTAYLSFAIFIAVLSQYQLLPVSWQTHFMEPAIARQLLPFLGFFASAWASKAYFRRRLSDGSVFFSSSFTVALGLIVASVFTFLQNRSYQGNDAASSVLDSYGSFNNNIVIATFFVAAAIYLTRDWRRYAGLAFFVGVGATTHFLQFKLLVGAVLVTLLGISGRVAALCAIGALLLAYAVGLGYIPEAILANPNSGIRLQFIADAISSAIDTWGIGVGYGKESVRWRYEFPNMPVFTFLPDPSVMTAGRMLEALSTGVENSFIESLLRTGILGFGLFTSAIFCAFPLRDLPRDVRDHAAMVFCALFIACFVNSTLESPLSAIGCGFTYGYLLALRASAGRSRLRQSEQHGSRGQRIATCAA